MTQFKNFLSYYSSRSYNLQFTVVLYIKAEIKFHAKIKFSNAVYGIIHRSFQFVYLNMLIYFFTSPSTFTEVLYSLLCFVLYKITMEKY